MQPQIQTLIILIDNALKIAEQMAVEQPTAPFQSLINILEKLKDRATAGELEPSNGVLTLGLVRGVADWIDSLDSPLIKALGEIESYYQSF